MVAFGRHRSTPRGVVLRINIVLGAAEGLANRVVAGKLSTSVPTVLLWRKRFESEGIAGILEDAEREAAIVEATMKTTPKDATQWSVRTMAPAQKVSSATLQRIWKKHKLQPRRVDSFKFSNDPQFARKVRDIVGLYMNLPDKAIVLSVDEKTRFRRWTGRNRSSRYGAACRSGRLTTTNAMERRRCSLCGTCSKEP